MFLSIPVRKENLGATASRWQIRLQKGRQSQLLLTFQAGGKTAVKAEFMAYRQSKLQAMQTGPGVETLAIVMGEQLWGKVSSSEKPSRQMNWRTNHGGGSHPDLRLTFKEVQQKLSRC